MTVRLVDASSLFDYELWAIGASVLSSLWIGWGTAWLTNKTHPIAYLLAAICFMILFGLVCVRAGIQRNRLNQETYEMPFIPDPTATPELTTG